MICPHCGVAFSTQTKGYDISPTEDLYWEARVDLCPECQNLVVRLWHSNYQTKERIEEFQVYPRGTLRPQPPEEVSKESPSIADDYRQACLVLQDSPKASAALSRRCLQAVLVDKAGVKKKASLYDQIQEVLDKNALPSYLSKDIDSIRVVGNFAAHPTKSISSGEIQDVAPNEAEWTLDTLISLFDFYYVLPAKSKKHRDDLNAKAIACNKEKVNQPKP